MSTSYYHTTTSSRASEIQNSGLHPTDAGECPNGVGIHLTADIVAARKWCHRLRAERDEYETEYVILEVTLPPGVDVLDDQFPGNGPSGAVVACTTDPIPASNIKPVEWL